MEPALISGVVEKVRQYTGEFTPYGHRWLSLRRNRWLRRRTRKTTPEGSGREATCLANIDVMLVDVP